MVALLFYVRNAGQVGGRGMARQGVRSSGAQPGFTTIAMICFFVLYLPIADPGRVLVQRRIVAGGVGRLLAAVVRAAWNNEQVQDAALRSLVIAVSAASLATIAATMAALATTRTEQLSRPDLQVCDHQPAADGAGDRHRGGAADPFFALIKVSTGYSGLGYLIPAHTAFCIPFAYLPIRARLESMDLTLERAAADLYATPWKAFRRVTLPLLWPGILAGFMLAFVDLARRRRHHRVREVRPARRRCRSTCSARLRRADDAGDQRDLDGSSGLSILLVTVFFFINRKKV